MIPNPILLEVFKNRFSSIAEEMGVTLTRTAFSPNIKERRDFSCAIFDKTGDMIAQAAHIPVHLGSMSLSVKAAIEGTKLLNGDMAILNDPFKGGTHLPDITLVAPVFTNEEGPSFYIANRAHHSDVGGITAGSMPVSTSLLQEGIIIPPLKIIKDGEVDRDLLAFFLNNVRTPGEREGDFSAQVMANLTGVQRIEDLIGKYGLKMTRHYSRFLMDYAERITRIAISEIPDGIYSFEDVMDNDGISSSPVSIRVKLTISGDNAQLDFSGSDPQVKGSINAVRSITLSAVLYTFRSLIKNDIPTNAGCQRPIKVITKPGSIVDAEFPAAVAGGNVETSQRIVDVILGALAQAIPDRIPAASQGTMNNITIGGFDSSKQNPFAYYETLGGGMGAGAHSKGESAIHSHMTNTLNTPVEALEYAYPFLVTEYSIRRGTGGLGHFNGGDGLIREIMVTEPAEVTILSERREQSPYGLQGGDPGCPGRNILIRNEEIREMPGKFRASIDKGDRIRIETPGGGGFGKHSST